MAKLNRGRIPGVEEALTPAEQRIVNDSVAKVKALFNRSYSVKQEADVSKSRPGNPAGGR